MTPSLRSIETKLDATLIASLAFFFTAPISKVVMGGVHLTEGPNLDREHRVELGVSVKSPTLLGSPDLGYVC